MSNTPSQVSRITTSDFTKKLDGFILLNFGFIFSLSERPLAFITAFEWFIFGLSLFLLIKPFEVGYLALAGIVGGSLILKFPSIANHEFLLLIYLGFFLVLRRNPNKLLTYSRMIMGGAYLFAGIHKLNAGFFDDGKTCLEMFLPLSIESLGVWAGVFVVIEILLGFIFILQPQKLMKGALWFALGFHILTSMYGFLNFSAVAMLLLFASKEKVQKRTWWILVVHGLGYWAYQMDPASMIHIAMIAKAWLILILSSNHKEEFQTPNFNFRKATLITFLSLWCLAPYWGGAHYPTFSMFSNLQIQSVSSNSYFLSRPLINLNQDWWSIVAIDNPQGLPYFGFELNRVDPNGVILHTNHLYHKERSGSMTLKNVKSSEIRQWPEDFPLKHAPSWMEVTFLARRPITDNYCQW